MPTNEELTDFMRREYKIINQDEGDLCDPHSVEFDLQTKEVQEIVLAKYNSYQNKPAPIAYFKPKLLSRVITSVKVSDTLQSVVELGLDSGDTAFVTIHSIRKNRQVNIPETSPFPPVKSS